jgi:hypothetical protein
LAVSDLEIGFGFGKLRQSKCISLPQAKRKIKQRYVTGELANWRTGELLKLY